MKNVAVLTISDTAFLRMRKDLSGPAVRARLEESGWPVPLLEVLPDEKELIARRMVELADSGDYVAIVTTGGTGVALRDVTPEATRSVIDREIPGLGEQMRALGREQTPLAALSRSMAGTRGKVLIVNLPGSPKGAVESLDAILYLLPHILGLLNGWPELASHEKREPASGRP